MRILLADDHDLVRETLAAFLQAEGLQQVTLAATLDEALAQTGDGAGFDLVLLDYDMPGMEGLAGLRRMIETAKGRPVALMSGAVSPEVAEAALEMGAAGFVPKQLAARSLLAAVRYMASGEIFAPINMIRRPTPEGSALSPRELDVLRGISAGKSNKEIARDLDLQEVTVKLHAKTMSRKLGARNRTHAAMIARDKKLL